MIPENRKKPAFPEAFIKEEKQFPDIGSPVNHIPGSNQPVLRAIEGNRCHQVLKQGDLPMEISHHISRHYPIIREVSSGRKKA
jgi:hypothetical protein